MPSRDATSFSFWPFVDQFIQPLCPLCEQPASRGLLCTLCRTWLEPLADPCPGCGAPDTLTDVCGRCQRHPRPWARARLAWSLSGATRFLIHRMKYHQDYACARSLAHCWWSLQRSPPTVDALLPVPQHRRRLDERGFNQAEWLARQWQRPSGLPLWAGAVRSRPTRPLEGLNRHQRRRALRGAFTLDDVPPERLAIVDDVFTSGATAAELARTLAAAGARHIEVWALARTPLGDH